MHSTTGIVEGTCTTLFPRIDSRLGKAWWKRYPTGTGTLHAHTLAVASTDNDNDNDNEQQHGLHSLVQSLERVWRSQSLEGIKGWIGSVHTYGKIKIRCGRSWD